MSHGARAIPIAAALVVAASTSWAQGAKPLKKCAHDAVVAGTVCMDKYEESVWRVPDPLVSNRGLVAKIQGGKATVADLANGGATQLGIAIDDYAPCADSGQNCTNDIYAVSLGHVPPSRYITWFQAQRACTNARKRLPTNAEWQAAVAGTPDPGGDDGSTDCNTASFPSMANTGSRGNCVSSDGAFDMVGNVHEWVGDWVPRSTACGDWSAGVSSDYQCLAGANTTGEPGALLRGGSLTDGWGAGPFEVIGSVPPSFGPDIFPYTGDNIGVRCAR